MNLMIPRVSRYLTSLHQTPTLFYCLTEKERVLSRRNTILTADLKINLLLIYFSSNTNNEEKYPDMFFDSLMSFPLPENPEMAEEIMKYTLFLVLQNYPEEYFCLIFYNDHSYFYLTNGIKLSCFVVYTPLHSSILEKPRPLLTYQEVTFPPKNFRTFFRTSVDNYFLVIPREEGNKVLSEKRLRSQTSLQKIFGLLVSKKSDPVSISPSQTFLVFRP
jgi:hypothetical protein